MPAETYRENAVRLVNFDFDGVIADTFNRLLDLCVTAQARTGEGRPPVAADLRTLENLTFEGLAHCLGIPDRAIPRFLETTFTLQNNLPGDVSFFAGMKELLRQLHGEADVAIITSSSADVVRGYLHDHGVAGMVAEISGGETGRSKEASIRANIERFSVTPGQACMIGDAISDIRQGKAAGVTTIAVSWGFHTRQMLERESPDFLADNPEALSEILRDMTRKNAK